MKKAKGFTLIELSLSLIFIAALSLIVAFMVNDIIKVFNRGVVVKSINSVGRDLIDDFTETISGSATKDLTTSCATYFNSSSDTNSSYAKCVKDKAYKFTTLTRNSSVKVGNTTIADLPVFGAFCTGVYSYIWNSGYMLGGAEAKYSVVSVSSPATFKYRKNGQVVTTWTNKNQPFALLKVRDPSRAVCAVQLVNNGYNSITSNSLSPVFDISSSAYAEITEDPVDLLATNENKLALYELSIFRPAQDNTTKNALYTVSFILATIRGGINIRSNGNYCATPTDYQKQDFDYCAINKFNFTVQVVGE